MTYEEHEMHAEENSTNRRFKISIPSQDMRLDEEAKV